MPVRQDLDSDPRRPRWPNCPPFWKIIFRRRAWYNSSLLSRPPVRCTPRHLTLEVIEKFVPWGHSYTLPNFVVAQQTTWCIGGRAVWPYDLVRYPNTYQLQGGQSTAATATKQEYSGVQGLSPFHDVELLLSPNRNHSDLCAFRVGHLPASYPTNPVKLKTKQNNFFVSTMLRNTHIKKNNCTNLQNTKESPGTGCSN